MSQEIAEKAYELGKKYEKKYGGCSQCVVAALQDAFDIQNPAIFKAASGLAAGGGGYTDGNCGAYTGALMMLSSLRGRERNDLEGTAGRMFESFQLAGEIHNRFIQEYGSVICRDIHMKVFGRPFYLNDPDEFKKFEAAGAHEVHCPEVVGKAARWAAELIVEKNLV